MCDLDYRNNANTREDFFGDIQLIITDIFVVYLTNFGICEHWHYVRSNSEQKRVVLSYLV